jgi:hypothetical protein
LSQVNQSLSKSDIIAKSFNNIKNKGNPINQDLNSSMENDDSSLDYKNIKN